MTRRREVEARLALFGELSGILGAMRGFALTELRRLAQREAAQRLTEAALGEALAAVAPALPEPPSGLADTCLLLGSVRGFCASFNEDVARLWDGQARGAGVAIVVGERLQTLMAPAAGVIPVAGAVGAADAAAAINRILAALASTPAGAGLVVCLRDEQGAVWQRLLPLRAGGDDGAALPVMNEAAPVVAAGVAQHWLFHRLLALLLRSLHVENHMRLMQMENALQHIERATDTLARQRNRLRQEEIVEEIELVLGQRK